MPAAETWVVERIRSEGWTRFSLFPRDRQDGRLLVSRLHAWVEEACRSSVMIRVVDGASFIGIAFKDTTDAVHFRLAFGDTEIRHQPMPHADDRREPVFPPSGKLP